MDIITALNRKRTVLVRQKNEIHKEAQRRIAEIDQELSKVDAAWETLNSVLQDFLCPVCNGTGTTRQCDAAGQMEDVECTACGGTGVKM